MPRAEVVILIEVSVFKICDESHQAIDACDTKFEGKIVQEP